MTVRGQLKTLTGMDCCHVNTVLKIVEENLQTRKC